MKVIFNFCMLKTSSLNRSQIHNERWNLFWNNNVRKSILSKVSMTEKLLSIWVNWKFFTCSNNNWINTMFTFSIEKKYWQLKFLKTLYFSFIFSFIQRVNTWDDVITISKEIFLILFDCVWWKFILTRKNFVYILFLLPHNLSLYFHR